MNALLRSVGRVGAVTRKELASLFRRPRLLVALVLGPFVVLSLVGLGFRRSTGPLETVFVANEANQLGDEIAERVDGPGSRIVFRGIVADEDEAVDRLRSGDVDVVVIVPEDAAETVRQGSRAVFTVVHDRLDPFEEATIALIAGSTVDTVNRSILQRLVQRGQDESETVAALLPLAAENARLMREAAEQGDGAAARERRAALSSQLRTIEANTGGTEVLLSAMEEQLGGDAGDSGLGLFVSDLRDRAARIDAANGDDATLEEMRALERDVSELEELLAEFREIDPEVLVSPFGSVSHTVDAVTLEPIDFYAPGAMALLIQHLAITFAGLSLVRERQLGTPELFQVSPLRPVEVLAGKYLAFLAVSLAVAAALGALLLAGFGVPLRGSVPGFLGVVVLLVLTSLGIGFLVSATVDSDLQAVNAAMIVLLLSLFFSGFFFSVERLTPGVRVVSWLLPITHALDSLRDVMFRDSGVATTTWLVLAGGSLAAFAGSWLLLARRLRPQ